MLCEADALETPGSHFADRTVSRSAELAIIVPTFNERANIRELVKRLEACLAPIHWEVIFVDDDSPDGTAEHVRATGIETQRVRCLQRIGRRGLSSACIEGFLATAAPYLAVIDGDLQHDERLLPKMLEILRKGQTDIVLGSRYIDGGGIGEWSQTRALMSRVATRLSLLILRADLTDPMSGFFMIRRDVFNGTVRNLSGLGFKILVDLFASSPRPLRFQELPYQFRSRQAGESKLDNYVVWEYLTLLLDKMIGHIVPVRFIAFSLVGGIGIVVHLLIQALLFESLKVGFVSSQSIATMIAMTFNFSLNNVLTYRDMRLKGWGWIYGWVSFTISCSVGALANVVIASHIYSMDTFWVFSSLAGILIGAMWNYAVSAMFTWRKQKM